MPWIPWGASNNGQTEGNSTGASNMSNSKETGHSSSRLPGSFSTKDGGGRASKSERSTASTTPITSSLIGNDTSESSERASNRSYVSSNSSKAGSSSASWLSSLIPPSSDPDASSTADNGARWSGSPSPSSSRPPPVTPTAWSHYLSTETLVPSLVTAGALISTRWVYVRYLRRVPGAGSITPAYWGRRSLLGVVTSVGDGDGFRLFHTPGGRLAGWGWLPWRRVPRDRRALKDATISVRLAGVDAPEGAHFGQPGQPGAAEAHAWLRAHLLGRRVRVYVWRRDQYERAVATALRYGLAGLVRRDVGLRMLREGLATVYEARSGAEFGGLEARYRRAERWARLWKRGIWGLKDAETPREYKDRMKSADNTDARGTEGPPTTTTTTTTEKAKKKTNK